jgi:FMN reductase
MGGKRTIVGVSGSVTRPSRTTALVNEIVDRIASKLDYEVRLIELVDHAPDLFAALTPNKLEGRGREIVELVQNADLLVVGTPVYRASMTGALKHLFDLVDHRSFVSKPVVVAATGGSLLHGLITEHQLRPLFGFLNALTLPTTVYAVESDFENYQVATAKIHDRIDRIVEEATLQLSRLDHHIGARRIAATA